MKLFAVVSRMTDHTALQNCKRDIVLSAWETEREAIAHCDNGCRIEVRGLPREMNYSANKRNSAAARVPTVHHRIFYP